MSYANIIVLPRPHNVEFKCVGGLIFDINYVDCGAGPKRWRNSKGHFHRENGPATIWDDGSHAWRRYGKPHREDGPAIIWHVGREYWLNGIYYSEEDFNEEMRRRHELRKCKSLTETP